MEVQMQSQETVSDLNTDRRSFFCFGGEGGSNLKSNLTKLQHLLQSKKKLALLTENNRTLY